MKPEPTSPHDPIVARPSFESDADSPLRRPSRFLGLALRDLWSSRHLAVEFFKRDLSSKYRESFLGAAWAFIPPVLMAVGFSLAHRSNLLKVEGTDIPYGGYVLFNAVLWQLFLEAFNAPVQGFLGSKSLLAKVRFPVEAIYLAKLGEIALNLCVKLLILAAIFVWYGVAVTSTTPLAFVGLSSIVLFGFSLGLLLLPALVLFEDSYKGISLAMNYLFLLTPAAYPIPSEGLLGTIIRHNPLTPLIQSTREWAMSQPATMYDFFLAVVSVSAVGLFFGWLFGRLATPALVERVSN